MMYTRIDNHLFTNLFTRQERKTIWNIKSNLKHRSVSAFEKTR